MQSDCVFRVVRVLGTMKKAEQEAIARARREVVRMRMRGEKEDVGGGVLDGMFGWEIGGGDVDVEMGLDDEEDEDGEGSDGD